MINQIIKRAVLTVLVGASCAVFSPVIVINAASVSPPDAQTASLLSQIQNLQNIITQLQFQIQQKTATPLAFASTQMFVIGDRVKTVANLNVRSKPATNPSGKILCTQPAGALGTVAGGPQTGSGYTWWNISYDSGCSGWSIQDYLVKADTISPSVPTSISASAISPSEIDLSWVASTDNVGVVGYTIYRNGVQIATTANTSYANTSLAAATTYSYTVSAFDAAGNVSAQSGSVSATTQPLSLVTPSNLMIGTVVKQQNSTTTIWQVPLSWIDNSSNETGFVVERGTDGINFSNIYLTGANATSITDVLQFAGTYVYRVKAVNSTNGTSSLYSNIATTTVM